MAGAREEPAVWRSAIQVAQLLSPTKWKRTPEGAKACCPCHDDNDPSLYISESDDGKLIVFCQACQHAGQQLILDELQARGIRLFRDASRATTDSKTRLRNVERLVATHFATDAQGEQIHKKLRYEEFTPDGTRTGKKRFDWLTKYGHNGSAQWKRGLDGASPPLYRQHELASRPNEDVHFCEGELKADLLAALGLVATSCMSRRKELPDLSVLNGRRIFLHVDNDKSGEDQASAIATALRAIECQVILVRYPDCGPKGDVKDFLDKPDNGLEQLLARCEVAELYPISVEATKVRRLEFDDEITLDIRVNAIVKGILHRGELGAVYGPSTVGKTFCVLDLAYHVAHGIDWHGHRIRQRAPVLYVALEGERGFRHRMLALRKRLGSAGRYFARHVLPAPLDKSQRGAEGQASIIESAKELAAAAGESVGLIVIDTLSRAIAGDDENSAQAISAFIGRAAEIGRATGAAVIVVHHPGKDEARGMRGSNAFLGAADMIMKITQDGEVREVETEKVKDGQKGRVLTYRLKVVDLGADEDGDQITSCIVDVMSKPKAKRQRPPANSQAEKALTELEELVIDGKGEPADGYPRAPLGVLLVRKSDWRDACLARQLTVEGDSGSEQKAFKRAQQALERAGWVSGHGDFVWIMNDGQFMSGRGSPDIDKCPVFSTTDEH
jgi:hypothetical protein